VVSHRRKYPQRVDIEGRDLSQDALATTCSSPAGMRMAVKTTALVLPGNGRPVPFHKDRAAAEEAGARRREPVQATCTTESTQCFPGRPPRLLQSSPLF